MVAVVVAIVCAPGVASAGGAAPLASRAAKTGDIPDNPLLASVPADTPYVFASFKPVPLEAQRGLVDVFAPIARKAFTDYMAAANPTEQRTGRQVLKDIAALDVKRFEQVGFTIGARFAFYELAGHGVLRLELASGDRLFKFVEHWNDGAEAPVERAGRHYWISASATGPVFLGIGPRELVVTFAPRDVIQANLDLLLGIQRPAKSLTTVQLRALAQRDGFTGQGVGFVDVARAGARIAALLGAGDGCSAALAEVARRVPRIAVGLDDITPRRFSLGVVMEVAPAVVAELRGLSGALAGFDRAIGQRPLVAFATAANVERVRPLLGRVGGSLGELGRACQISGMGEAMDKLAAAAARPLPPFLAGLRGGFAVVNDIKLGPNGPESVVGFGSVQLDHTGGLAKLAPNIEIKPDRKPRSLAKLAPWPGHLAASETTLGLAFGPKSEATVVDLVNARPVPAPLAVFQLDYPRIASIAPNFTADSNERRVAEALGLTTMQLVADDRGLVVWTSFDLH
jgi:hypothetical protein